MCINHSLGQSHASRRPPYPSRTGAINNYWLNNTCSGPQLRIITEINSAFSTNQRESSVEADRHEGQGPRGSSYTTIYRRACSVIPPRSINVPYYSVPHFDHFSLCTQESRELTVHSSVVRKRPYRQNKYRRIPTIIRVVRVKRKTITLPGQGWPYTALMGGRKKRWKGPPG